MLAALELLCTVALAQQWCINAEVAAALLSRLDPARGTALHIEALAKQGKYGQALLVAQRAVGNVPDPSGLVQQWNAQLEQERGSGWKIAQSRPIDKTSVRSLFAATSAAAPTLPGSEGSNAPPAGSSRLSGLKAPPPGATLGGLKTPPPPAGSSSLAGMNLKAPPPGANLGAAASRRQMKRTTTTNN
jgi:hypothetical protein